MSSKEQFVAEHFPDIEPGAKPCGPKILVQLRTVKAKSAGGIVLVEETKEFNNGNTQLARIVSVGDIAFRNRETGEVWREGVWAQVGDLVVIPKWGGFRFEVPIAGSDSKAIFATIPDTSVEMVVYDNFDAFNKIL